MEKKKYTNPSITVVEMRGENLLDLSPQGTHLNTNGITKGDASQAAGKFHYNIWDYEEGEEDFEDKEDEKKGARH